MRTLGAVTLATLLLAGGCKLESGGEPSKSAAQDRVRKTAPQQRVVLDAKLANRIVLDLKQGRGDERWRGKVLVVEGTVRAKRQAEEASETGTRHVNEVRLLVDDYAALEAECVMHREQARFVHGLQVGQRVALAGEVHLIAGELIRMRGCVPHLAEASDAKKEPVREPGSK